MKPIYYIYYILLFFILIIIIYYTFSKSLTLVQQPTIKNSLIILWDIHCKQQFLDHINYINHKMIHIIELAFVIQIETNYVCFMNKHPQEYDDINKLIDEIVTVCKNYNIKNIVSFSTAGSTTYKIGSVLQFDSAMIDHPQKYKLDSDHIKSEYVLVKTDKIVKDPITNTKGFIPEYYYQVASGQDEFVIYIVSNRLKIPCLTLTGISDRNMKIQYDEYGNLAAKNIIVYFFTLYSLQ